jgi:hypothetical protein
MAKSFFYFFHISTTDQTKVTKFSGFCQNLLKTGRFGPHRIKKNSIKIQENTIKTRMNFKMSGDLFQISTI